VISKEPKYFSDCFLDGGVEQKNSPTICLNLWGPNLGLELIYRKGIQ
jgi:hypothetical protein